jgi:hypothetical protein
MTTKAKIQELLRLVYNCGNPQEGMTVEVWQDEPWTAVTVDAEGFLLQKTNLLDGEKGNRVEAIEHGFSKVCWPDQFDSQFGIDLAVEKAIAKIAKQLASE